MNLIDVARRAIAAGDGQARVFAAMRDFDRRGAVVHLAGAGKAAGQMARGVVDGLAQPCAGGPPFFAAGWVVTKERAFAGFAPAGVAVRFAGHPAPDERSRAAGADLGKWLARRRIDELVVFVLSGGASALLATPCEGLTLHDLQQTSAALLAAGTPIEDINRVRKQLSETGAGRLAVRCRSRVEVLVLSDVVTGDLAAVGSGPFFPEPDGVARARAILEEVADAPPRVKRWLADPPPAARAPTPDDPAFARVHHRRLAGPETLLAAAVDEARTGGAFAKVVELPLSDDDVERVAGRLMAAADSLPPGSLVVGGGEPTVVLPHAPGRGGRNQQLALRMAERVAQRPFRFLAVGSDGTDGPTDAAGAAIDGSSWQALEALGDARGALARADAYPLLDAAGLLLRLGPTGTNLCDLHLLAVD